jgi:YMGG-like Gly-zipper
MKKIMMIISASWLILACSDNSRKEVQQAKTMAIDSMKMETKIKDAKQEVIDSMRMEAQIQTAKQFTRDSLKDANKPKVYATKKHYNSAAESYVSRNPNNEVYTTPTENAPVYKSVKKKRRISRPVEGALIGAGVGAVSGAIINKNNRGKGAIIGGVIGAGVGAGAGLIIDKKEKEKRKLSILKIPTHKKNVQNLNGFFMSNS